MTDHRTVEGTCRACGKHHYRRLPISAGDHSQNGGVWLRCACDQIGFYRTTSSVGDRVIAHD